MLRRILGPSVVVLFCAAAAGAQIRMTMAGQCECTYTKPTEIEGAKATGGTDWQSGEVNGDTISYHGYYEETWSDSDKILYRCQGRAR